MISQTVEYSLRAMSHLASRVGTPATSAAIAEATQVPHGYLSKLMSDLVRANLVRSSRGRKGGFTLARSPEDITVLDIVNAVDPIRRVEHCPLNNPMHTRLCALHQCLDDAMAYIERVFSQATLCAVVDAADGRECCRRLFPQQNRAE